MKFKHEPNRFAGVLLQQNKPGFYGPDELVKLSAASLSHWPGCTTQVRREAAGHGVPRIMYDYPDSPNISPIKIKYSS